LSAIGGAVPTSAVSRPERSLPIQQLGLRNDLSRPVKIDQMTVDGATFPLSHEPAKVSNPPRPCEKTIATNHWEIYCRCADYGIAKTSDTPS
jgi:hypothetical protein